MEVKRLPSPKIAKKRVDIKRRLRLNGYIVENDITTKDLIQSVLSSTG